MDFFFFFLPTVQKQLNREMVIFLTNGVGKMDIHMKKIQINLDLNFILYRKIQNMLDLNVKHKIIKLSKKRKIFMT